MHEFPEDFNQQMCRQLSQNNQMEHMNKCRQEIYVCSIDNAKKSGDIIYTFPETLERNSRTQLCTELLARFNKIKCIFVDPCNIYQKQSFEEVFGCTNDLNNFMSRPVHENTGFNIDKIQLDY